MRPEDKFEVWDAVPFRGLSIHEPAVAPFRGTAPFQVTATCDAPGPPPGGMEIVVTAEPNINAIVESEMTVIIPQGVTSHTFEMHLFPHGGIHPCRSQEEAITGRDGVTLRSTHRFSIIPGPNTLVRIETVNVRRRDDFFEVDGSMRMQHPGCFRRALPINVTLFLPEQTAMRNFSPMEGVVTARQPMRFRFELHVPNAKACDAFFAALSRRAGDVNIASFRVDTETNFAFIQQE